MNNISLRQEDNMFFFLYPDASKSQKFYDCFYDGGKFAIIQKNKNKKWQIYNILDKKFSSEFYWIGYFYGGNAVIQKEQNGLYQYINENFKLSQKFYKASDFCEGYGEVLLTPSDESFKLIDLNWNISDAPTLIGDQLWQDYKNKNSMNSREKTFI